MGVKIMAIVSGGIALVCGYFVYMACTADDQGGIWLFAAFGFLFAVLPLAEIGKMITRKMMPSAFDRISGATTLRPTFVPHWQLMAMIGLVLLLILLGIFIPLFRA